MENASDLKEALSSNQCKCDCHQQVDLLLQNTLKDKKEIRELELKLAKLEGLADKIKDKDQTIAAMQLSIELYKNIIEPSLKLTDDHPLENKDKLSQHEEIIQEKHDQDVMKDQEITIHKEKQNCQLPIDQLAQSTPAPINGGHSNLKIVKIPGCGLFYATFDYRVHGRGWMVIQRRFDGSVDFRKEHIDSYVNGFGNLNGEHWLGLEKMHLITTFDRYELYIQLVDNDNQTHYARYDHFVIGNSSERYCIKSLGKYTGNAGDAMRPIEKAKFLFNWWQSHIGECNLNGIFNGKKENGIWWIHLHSLKAVQMLIRPKSNTI